MASPLVFPPLRQESLLGIRGRLERDLNAGRDPEDDDFWDLTPGSAPSDLLMASALEFERLWDFGSIDVPAASMLEFAWGDYLDGHGQTIDEPRTQAAPSHGELTFTAVEGTLIPIGAEAGTEQLDAEEEPPTFRTTAGGTIGVSGTITLPAEAVEPGSAGNVSVGAVVEMLTDIEGVTVTNAAAFVDGEDLETDDSYRERLKIAYSAARGGGSVDDLRAWSLSYSGVGFVRVVPLWNGPGTVRVVITDPENNPVSNVVENGLQADLDPISSETETTEAVTFPAAVVKVKSTTGFAASGRILVGDKVINYTNITATEFKGCTGGEGLVAKESDVLQQGLGRGKAPPGSMVTVDTPAILTVATEVNVKLDDGYSLTGANGTTDIEGDIKEAIMDYINSLPPGGEDPPGEESPPGSGFVLLNRVKQAVLSVDGVYDVGVIKLAGAAANLAVGALQVPQLGVLTAVKE